MRKVLFALMLICASVTQLARAEMMQEFSRCVADNGATMYSAWWCPYCYLQLKEFDGALVRTDMQNPEKTKTFSFMKDCGGDKPGTLIPSCVPKEARGVPFWTFRNSTPEAGDGKPYTGGGLDLDEIGKYSGCPLPPK